MISIHALLAESDFRSSCKGISYFLFLSTLSLRRATFLLVKILIKSHNFYPRSPCGERPPPAPQNESSIKFLSTLSLRRATANWFDLWGWAEYFYPRSPCGERHQECSGSQQPDDFYPRSPCGERRSNPRVTMHTWQFLSTLSLRRAT